MKNVDLANMSAFLNTHMRYGIEQMKAAPKDMVLYNATPWCHPFLYEQEMPRVLQDAQAACALYITKNEKNASTISRHIELRADELVANPLPTAPGDVLAGTQALLLYQIIRVLDGDVRRERLRADAAMDRLESYTHALRPLVDVEDDSSVLLTFYPTASSMSFWKSWIFRQSLCRTLIACFYFLSIYHVLKENFAYCDAQKALSSLWAASAHLWNARSVMEFTTAWKEKKHFPIRDLDLTELIADARADDIDSFGKILLVAFMGIDDGRGWFLTRGGAL
ncbi:hypothetical protein NA57DRAFT_47048 [Rhizodiscina lignyota]|uniref:Uncharacterized protein n=1 Tax=Rhizodiscina lignyota TaxID=1504668 RepID=A0A9P4M122_9PEZI|nr:hypothetical protein NA57DRAFT_47048 [Rhizodiscina lignyota]